MNIRSTYILAGISQLVLLWLASFSCHGQSIYISTLPFFFDSSELYRIDVNTCETTLVTKLEGTVLDICYHPNKKLYGITGDGELVEIDTVTGAFTLVYDFPGGGFNSLICSAAGRFYTITITGDRWSYHQSTGPRFQGWVGGGSAGDLTFRFGRLYLAANNGKILVMDPDGYGEGSVFFSDPTVDPIFGIVSTGAVCNDLQTFGITSGDFSDGSSLYTIDFETQTISYYCTITIMAGGGASAFEYLGSLEIGMDSIHLVADGCGGSQGTASFAISGGNGPVSFSVDGGAFIPDTFYNDLPAGTHAVVVLDSAGCSKEFSFEIPGAVPLQVDLVSTDASCGAANGTITIHVTQGESPYLFFIDQSPGQLSNVFDTLAAGQYDIEVVDAAGCSFDTLVTVGAIPLSIIDDVEVVHTSCGEDNGSIAIHDATGFPPFQYALDGMGFDDEILFEQLQPGTYEVSLQDAFGCVTVVQVVINPSTAPEIDSVLVLHTNCNGQNGVATIVPLVINPDNQYSIDAAAYADSPVFVDLAPGMYTFYVRDAAGCEDVAMASIQPSSAIAVDQVEVTPAACDAPTGAVVIQPNLWTGTLTMTLDQSTVQFPEQFHGLETGDHHLVLSDDAGCQWDTILHIPFIDCPFFIPNVFSPDFDGNNDFFSIQGVSGSDVTILEYLIFDRWGNMLYRSANFLLTMGEGRWWDGTTNGKPAPSTVYAYKITVEETPGSTSTYTGDVTLLR